METVAAPAYGFSEFYCVDRLLIARDLIFRALAERNYLRRVIGGWVIFVTMGQQLHAKVVSSSSGNSTPAG